MPQSSTYNGDPSSSTLNRIRFELGDTDQADFILRDAEINFLASKYPEPLMAAAAGAEAIAAKFARKVSEASGGVRKDLSAQWEHYRDLAVVLRGKAAVTAPVAPYFGGLSIAEKNTDAEDTDLVQSRFAEGQFDHPDLRRPPHRSSSDTVENP